MAKQAVYQVRMDEEIQDQVEALYRSLGTTFAEAVRIFAVQSIREKGNAFYIVRSARAIFRCAFGICESFTDLRRSDGF